MVGGIEFVIVRVVEWGQGTVSATGGKLLVDLIDQLTGNLKGEASIVCV